MQADPVAVYTPTTRKQMPSNLEEIEIPNALAPDQTPSVSGILEAVRRHRIQTLVLTNSSPLTWPRSATSPGTSPMPTCDSCSTPGSRTSRVRASSSKDGFGPACPSSTWPPRA